MCQLIQTSIMQTTKIRKYYHKLISRKKRKSNLRNKLSWLLRIRIAYVAIKIKYISLIYYVQRPLFLEQIIENYRVGTLQDLINIIYCAPERKLCDSQTM